MFSYQASFDTLRSAAPGDIGANYAAVGAVLPSEAVMLIFKNGTNGDVLVSTDGSTNMLGFPPTTSAVYEIRANAPSNIDFMFRKGTQFSVKDGTTAATTGVFYIEAVLVTAVTP